MAELMKRITDGLANGISKTAALSPDQVKKIAEAQEKYLSEMPDMNGEAINKLISRNLGAIGVEVYHSYLKQIKELYLPISINRDNFDDMNKIRYFDITRWVIDSSEKSIDKLVNVYQVLSGEDCNIALIYRRTKKGTRVIMGVVNTKDDSSETTDNYKERLIKAIKGNFPGSNIKNNSDPTTDEGKGMIKDIGIDSDCSVAIISNLPSEKSENYISQSMEKLLDGIVPESEDCRDEYSLVLLAKPATDSNERKNRLFEIRTALTPYSEWQTNFTYTEGMNEISTSSVTANIGGSIGSQNGATITNTSGKSTATTDSVGGAVTVGVETPPIIKKIIGINGSVSGNYQHSKTKAVIESLARAASTAHTGGFNFGLAFSRSSSSSAQIGKNEGITQNFSNYGVVDAIQKIEEQIKRLDLSSALGMWEFSAYAISRDEATANNVAHMYMSLTQGEQSYLSESAINCWNGTKTEEREQTHTILEEVKRFCTPIFSLNIPKAVDDGKANHIDPDAVLMYPAVIDGTVLVSGKELAQSLNFPRKSVMGLPVIESAPFGRDVQRFNEITGADYVEIGSIYHMYNDEKKPVELDLNSFTSHVFITGSTGTGKTTTVLNLLKKIIEKKETENHFLVVEPTKGEYKSKIGGLCKVYGTNLDIISDLLKINPFWFPEKIHVLEHIDRLTEVLNACWPMYAAMPAVLKDAIEMAYKKVGWDLKANNRQDIFPTFYDLLETLPQVMEESSYSNDTKSDYSGALITRVKSLTNGLNGLMFCDNTGLSQKELFEQNVILDISRIGNTETKALVMGMVVIKLQEYWMSKYAAGIPTEKAGLKHVTVLEEAHNLLRKTSFNQSQDSGNMIGKSVEMLTNAIAEMRAYGEGFIIADQAPDLLDEAVIRNTNTKIILRLPDYTDRKLAGLACSLNEDQVNEIAKIPNHTAVVYQNDWIEAVLCCFEDFANPMPYVKGDNIVSANRYDENRYYSYLFDENTKIELSKEEKDKALQWIDSLQIGSITKRLLRQAFITGKAEKTAIAYNLFQGRVVAQILEDNFDETAAVEIVKNRLHDVYKIKDSTLANIICTNIIVQICELKKEGDFVERYKLIAEKGVF